MIGEFYNGKYCNNVNETKKKKNTYIRISIILLPPINVLVWV